MGTKDILLVDDCENQLHLLSVILESQGFDVTAAGSGFKALELLKDNQYRVVITDYEMPGMNGIELATRVGQQHPGTGIVLVTAYAFPGVIEKAVGAGISALFSKPIDFRRLMEILRSALSAGEVKSGSDREGGLAVRRAGRLPDRDYEVRIPKGKQDCGPRG